MPGLRPPDLLNFVKALILFEYLQLGQISGIVLLFAFATIMSAALTAGYIRALRKRSLFEIPNQRSMHKKPILIGGGWSILFVVMLIWPLTNWPLEDKNVALLLSIVLLAIVSWFDDLETLPWVLRLIVHAIAVSVFLIFLPPDRLLFGGLLPIATERSLLFLGYVWFINLYNFMDGIDGITGVETATLGSGYVLVSLMMGHNSELLGLALITAGAAVGFLLWNWFPAKIIMGDVGSIPLGFILGGLMVDLANHGQLAAGLILPLYYICDASITLIFRIFRKEQFLMPHRQHFYQRAVLGGAGHQQVVLRIAAANIVLIGLAAASITWPLLALSAAFGVVAVLLTYLQRAAGCETTQAD